MPVPEHAQVSIPDPAELSQNLARVAERSHQLVLDFLTRGSDLPGIGMADPQNVGKAFLDLTAKMLADPMALARAQLDLSAEHAILWTTVAQRMVGLAGESTETGPSDRRFKNLAWSEIAVFDYIKQTYLITAESILSTVRGVEGLDEQTARKVDFYTRQFVDAMAPSNFIATNPQVLKATVETGGENLLKGLTHLLEDIDASRGTLSITMTDMNAFRLGENIAATPGKVVFQNEMMQLIQYAPVTEAVRRVPLLIVPPWINKFYVLDLRPQNSFIRWAVAQGHTVFVISWVNPDERLASKSFEDYMRPRPSRGTRRGRDGDRRAGSQPHRLLPRRDPARCDARLSRRQGREACAERHLFRRPWSISPRSATWQCSSTTSSLKELEGACASAATSRRTTWRCPSICCAPTT